MSSSTESLPDFSKLTPREWQVLHSVDEGKSNWHIGQSLNCSEGTVKKHLQRIYQKLGVENRMAAANLLRQFASWDAAVAIAA